MIRYRVPVLSVLLSLGLTAAAPDQGRAQAPERASPFMRVYAPAHPPYGFVHFCERMPAHCQAATSEEPRLYASPERLSELDEVNRAVNRAIKPATDMELYGVTELWTLPVDKGDCEDYALLKRHLLIARGWPIGALLMTVVRDEKGEGHAVLTARTAQGDYILDNKVDDVRLWSKVRYQFVMRQSYLNPRIWVSLDAREAVSPVPLAGVRHGR